MRKGGVFSKIFIFWMIALAGVFLAKKFGLEDNKILIAVMVLIGGFAVFQSGRNFGRKNAREYSSQTQQRIKNQKKAAKKKKKKKKH